MKLNKIAIILSLVSMNAFSATEFYECAGIGGVEEYRVGINVSRKKAAFFDNDTTSLLKLTATKILESIPPQTQMVFEGRDAGSPGKLVLYFNLTKMKASLSSIHSSGKYKDIGSAKCAPSKDWNELK